MVKENFKTKKSEIIFPEESGLIVEELLRKYGLKKSQEEGVKKFIELKVPQEKNKIFENLPGTKISKLIKDCAENKFTPEELSSFLKESLEISEKEAKNLAEDLENKILTHIKTAKEKPSVIKPAITSPPKEPKRPSGKDVYRELVE